MASLKVLSVVSEIYPLIKTGGLADVAGALPGALSAHDVEMRTVVPGYPSVMAALEDRELVVDLAELWGGPARVYNHPWHGMLRASERGVKRSHPTQKPVALMRWCLQRARLAPGALVYDPYMGSGPVAQACKELGYRYIGVELVEAYAEIAARRLSQEVMAL